jgi:hypothetical protein
MAIFHVAFDTWELSVLDCSQHVYLRFLRDQRLGQTGVDWFEGFVVFRTLGSMRIRFGGFL